jgi:hypothetical protein
VRKSFAIQQNDFSIARAQQRHLHLPFDLPFFAAAPMDVLLGELVLPEEMLPEVPWHARQYKPQYNPADFRCPRTSKFKRACKCGDAACGKGLCKHGVNKYRCKRDPCINIKGSTICKHAKQKQRCSDPDCRPNRPRCKHGILNPSPNRPRCSACLREKAEEKVAASSEEPSTPAVRVSTGRKVFPGGPWPMGLMRVSPELA